ncbi:uncharacterized protein LOC131466778 [Solea solea]|uniref:uncharacterized protein LOC131466778 n=1 Tax=Solea solea TaxID=90069 RepID=UPI00272A3FF7|nr:uncharacterized protein LOC131466778 [Solea solea]
MATGEVSSLIGCVSWDHPLAFACSGKKKAAVDHHICVCEHGHRGHKLTNVWGELVSQGDATEKLAHQVAAQVTAADRRFEEASGDADEEEKDEAHESSKGHVSEPAVECLTSPEFTSPQMTFDMEHKDEREPRVRPLTRQSQISRPQKQREKNEAQRRRPAVQTDMYHSRPSACVSVETVHTQSVGPTNNSCVHLFPEETGCSLNSVM